MNAALAIPTFDGVPAAADGDMPAGERVFAFLDGQQYVLYYPMLAARLGYKVALFLGHASYWGRYVMREHPERGGWFYASADSFADATGLSAHEQRAIRARLVKERVLAERLAGHPAQLHYRLDWRAIARALGSADAEDRGDDPASCLGSGMRVWPTLGRAAHSVAAGVYLSLLLHRQRAAASDSHFRLTQSDIRIALHLGTKVQRNAREALVQGHFYTEDGSGFRCHVNLQALEEALGLARSSFVSRRLRPAPTKPSVGPDVPVSGRQSRALAEAPTEGQPLFDQSDANAGTGQRPLTAAQLGFAFTGDTEQDVSAPAKLFSTTEGVVIHRNGCQQVALFEHLACPFCTSVPFLNTIPAILAHLGNKNKRHKNTTTARAGAREAVASGAKTASRRRSLEQNPKTVTNKTAAQAQPVQASDTGAITEPPMPKCLPVEWHDGVRRTLEQAPEAIRQTLLDELEGRLTLAGKTIHNPPGYLHRLIRLHADGKLQPALADKVASDRVARAKAMTAFERASRANADPHDAPTVTHSTSAPSNAQKQALEQLRALRQQMNPRRSIA